MSILTETVFMLLIVSNRVEHAQSIVIINHKYMLMCNHKIIINIMLCLLNSAVAGCMLNGRPWQVHIVSG